MNTQVREEAAAWLIEFRTEEVDAATLERFADWLRASPAHVSAYLKVASVWEDAADRPLERDLDALIRLARADGGNVVPLQEARASGPDAAAFGTPGSAADVGFTREQIAMSAKPSLRRRYAFAAAAIAAVSTTAVWFALTRDPVYGTQLGEQRTLELADGSTVELNALSSIRVHLRKAERRVELLSGQALFSVIHDAARPFVVVSGEARVEDVGTQFAVTRGLTATVVTVIEGRVAVRKDGDAAADARNAAALKALSEESASRPGSAAIVPVVLVSAGEQVSVASGAVSQPHRANVATATAWTQQQLVFESTPLSEAADAFNRFNARRLRIEGAALADFHVSGTFPARDPTSLSRFVLFLRAQPGIEVQESYGEISVRPK
jgi:transmembrane sensor